MAVSGAYFDAQKIESEALLSVLDAELSARNLNALLERVLEITTHTFNATLGLILLKEAEQQVLRVQAQVGFGDDLDDPTLAIAVGQGFLGQDRRDRRAGNLARLGASHGVLQSHAAGQGQSAVGSAAEVRARR